MSRGHFHHVYTVHDRSDPPGLHGWHSFCKIIPAKKTNANSIIFEECCDMSERWSALSDVSCWWHEKEPYYRGTRQGTDDKEKGGSWSFRRSKLYDEFKISFYFLSWTKVRVWPDIFLFYYLPLLTIEVVFYLEMIFLKIYLVVILFRRIDGKMYMQNIYSDVWSDLSFYYFVSLRDV